MIEFTTILLVLIFLIGLYVAYQIGNKIGQKTRDFYWKNELPSHRKDAVLKSRAILGGHFSEQMAPFLPNFPYLPTECKFLGKPIDFIAFNGMDDKKIDEVVFVEVKSGNSKLSSQEKNLKEAIKNKKVKWEEYRIPEELTKKRDLNFEDFE